LCLLSVLSESFKSPFILDIPSLSQHCRVLSLAYYKVFVFSLFKSLHLNNKVHVLDVQAAVDECKEALIEIDITNFIQVIIVIFFLLYPDDVWLSCVFLMNSLLVINALNYMDSNV